MYIGLNSRLGSLYSPIDRTRLLFSQQNGHVDPRLGDLTPETLIHLTLFLTQLDHPRSDNDPLSATECSQHLQSTLSHHSISVNSVIYDGEPLPMLYFQPMLYRLHACRRHGNGLQPDA